MNDNIIDVLNNIPSVILPLMKTGSFRVSAIAASGIPQFATGPQKWVLKNALIH